MDGRLEDALEIFDGLEYLKDKPADFYVNYSLALLKAAKAEAARSICEQGLQNFPNDLDVNCYRLKPIAWRANHTSSNKFDSAARRNKQLQTSMGYCNDLPPTFGHFVAY